MPRWTPVDPGGHDGDGVWTAHSGTRGDRGALRSHARTIRPSSASGRR